MHGAFVNHDNFTRAVDGQFLFRLDYCQLTLLSFEYLARTEVNYVRAEIMARTLEAIGLAEGQREHFANLSLFIANSLLNTTPHKAEQRLLNKVF